MQEELKKVYEIFSDYNKDAIINTCEIEKISLFKKINKLEMNLKCKQYIKIKELLEFENYLKDRFNIENVELHTAYSEKTEIPSIETSWKNIVEYISAKHKLTKVILQNSKVKVQDNIVIVTVFVTGVDFLLARGFDKALEKILKSLYGKTYKVKYVEEIHEEEIQKIENKSKMTEKYEIEKAISEAQTIMEEKEEAKENSKKEQEEVNKEEGLERYFARRITKERARRKNTSNFRKKWKH